MSKILFGKPVAEKIYHKLAKKMQELKSEGIKPYLATILIGDHPAAIRFVENKEREAQKIGIQFQQYSMLPSVETSQVLSLIETLNKAQRVTGIIVQLPIPPRLDQDDILNSIIPHKDVDGLNRSSPDQAKVIPAAVEAIIELLTFYQIEFQDKKIIILGKGFLIGEPLYQFLKKSGYDVEVLDKNTKNIGKYTNMADILIVATGGNVWVGKEMIKDNAVIVDCGAPEPEVDQEELQEVVAAISPVPGGIGPVTVAKLMEHVVELAKN